MSRSGAVLACVALSLTAVPAAAAARAAAPGHPVPGGGGRAHAGVVPGATSPAPQTTATDPASFPVKGIDIASYQHPNGAPINWTSVAASGVKFAYIKATEGTTYVNPYYQSDALAAKNAGLYVGAYAFVRPDSNDPIAQADWLLTNAPVPSDGRTLPPMIDIEWPYFSGISSCWGLTPAQMATWLRTFSDRVQSRIGRLPTIYTNSYWWDPCTGSNATFAASPLITAHYNGSPTPLPAGWVDWTFWQYTSTASVPGIVGAVDADVFNGTLADFAPLTGSPLVNGKYLSYAYIAASRQGAAVYINGLVKQGSAKGLIRSPERTVYLQRNLSGVWQTMLSRVTDWYGVFTVGFISVPTYQYRFVVSASGSAWGTTSGVASPPIFKYASYAYIAASRQGAAVYVNGLVQQGSATGIIRSAGRTIYLQRNLGGSWQTMLSRVTDGSGVFTVGFVSVADYQYRYVVTASASAAATTSGVVTTTTPA